MGGVNEKMKLSIIICAYNEEKGIGNLLRNLSSQRLPPEITGHETIVVASGCTDRTVPIIKEFMVKDTKIKLIEERERRGKAAALNKALSAATGDYIIFIPADVSPAADGLYHLITPLRDSEVVVVSGRPMQNPKCKNAGFVNYLTDMTYRIWGRLMETLNDAGLAAHCSGEFMAMRADTVIRIPEECAADDAYISVVAKRRGFIKFAPKAIGYNLMPSNVRDYVNQRRRWLYGHFQTYRLTGGYPTVMDTLIFSKPHLALKVLIGEIRESLKRIPFLFGATVMETIIYVLAIIDSLLDHQYTIWPVIESTKWVENC